MENEFERDLKHVISLKKRKEAKITLQKLENSISRKKSNSKIWLAAASVVLITSFLGYSLFLNQKQSSEELFTTYFEPYPNVLEPAVRSMEELSKKEIYFIEYENKNYDKAIKGFKTLAVKENKSDINFYLAMSFLNKGNDNEALKILEQLPEKQNRFSSQINWYKALIYIKQKHFKKATKSLDKLIQTNQKFKKSEARQLKKDLE